MINIRTFKLYFLNIAVELIGLVLIAFGIEKLKVASQSEEYVALLANDFEKFESITNKSIGWFFIESSLWRFGALAIGFLIIGLFKLCKKDKYGLLNSFVVFGIAFSLIHLGFFDAGFTHSVINFIGGILSENFKTKFIINGLIWSGIGIAIIWIALKKHYTQQQL